MVLNENIFLPYLNNLKCFENNPHVALGLSGGPDSMALLYLLNKWIKLKKGKLSALIFDHGIRSNSAEESYKANNMVNSLMIETIIIKAKKNRLIKKNMAQARTNRFEGLINFCNKNNILNLFLGHHFDDNLETYLIRKINGSNLEGLESMNDVFCFNNIQILRPLLQISKHSILSFNKKNNINSIYDPSNQDTNYTRVKIRNFLRDYDYKKIIKKDFLNLKKQIPNYKKMIWDLFILSIIDVKRDKIKISFDKLIELDDLIIEKHIMLLLKFFSKSKMQTKSSKINLFINTMKKPNFSKFNLSGIIIHKKSDFLIFYQK